MIDFWPPAIFLLKISSKISCARATQQYPYKFRLKSDDPMIRVLRVLRG